MSSTPSTVPAAQSVFNKYFFLSESVNDNYKKLTKKEIKFHPPYLLFFSPFVNGKKPVQWHVITTDLESSSGMSLTLESELLKVRSDSVLRQIRNFLLRNRILEYEVYPSVMEASMWTNLLLKWPGVMNFLKWRLNEIIINFTKL